MRDVIKRGLDFALALACLLLLLPTLLAIAAWIKWDSKGPILYRGERVGRSGRMFRILKFRTMTPDAERSDVSSTPADDARITRAGRFLRTRKLDELPQLLNVLRGEMSFVGPRPQVRWAVDLYTEEERGLLEVKPGITDYASLCFRTEGEILRGSSDPDRDYLDKIAPHKLRLGLAYVGNHSLWADAKIVLATIGVLAGIDPQWCLPRPFRKASPARSRFT